MNKKYSGYKDSGIEWIGQVPCEWDIAPIRALCYLGRGRVISNEEIASNIGEYPVYSSQTAENGIMGRLNTYDFDGEYVTWTTDGANAGTVFYRRGRFNCTNVCGTLKAKSKKVFLRYLPFVLNLGTKCYVRYDINPKLMNNEMAAIRISLPTCEEQKVIADFLDRKTEQIDDLIAKKERMIELLKEERAAAINQAVTKGLDPNVEMQDTGIEWLGKIPKHWETKKLKFLFRIINGATPQSSEPDYWDGDIFWATPDDFSSVHADGVLEETRRQISVAGYQSCGTTVAPQRSVIVSTRAPIGYVAVLGRDMCCNQGCRILIKRNETINERFYYFFLFVFADALASFGQGSTFKELSRDKLADFFLLDVPQDEQDQIVDFLDKKMPQIDGQISREERLIELLKEYRTALISEAVTGKIDVRN